MKRELDQERAMAYLRGLEGKDLVLTIEDIYFIRDLIEDDMLNGRLERTKGNIRKRFLECKKMILEPIDR